MPTWTLARLEAQLGAGLSALPGLPAQALMAPRPRRGWKAGQPPDHVRSAAALVLFYPRRGDRPYLVLTVRAGVLSRHGGQVSFPGGAIEPGEAVATAALREAAEEVGIDRSVVRVVGALTPLHIPVSDFIVHPIVGMMDRTPEFTHAAAEVERVLEVPFEDLLDSGRICVTTRLREDELVEVPYFALEGEKVWGATAMMLAELLCVVGAPPVVPRNS